MKNKKSNIMRASAFPIAAIAIAISNSAQAYDFQVNETTATIYGYAKLSVSYDFDSAMGPTVDHTAIGKGTDGHIDFNAYESRIGFSTSTDMGGSKLKTNIEGDFYGLNGAFNLGVLRLRHAYGEWNGILGGQTWSNAQSFVGATPTVSFTGLGGIASANRQAQIRYTAGKFSAALEDPSGDVGGRVASPDLLQNLAPKGSEHSGTKSRFPDFTARYTDWSGAFRHSTAAVIRQLEVEDNAANIDDSVMGWGIVLEAALDLTDRVTVRGSFIHGDAIGGYLNENPQSDKGTAPASAFVDAGGNLKAIESTGGTVGVSIKAGPGTINAVAFQTTTDLDENYFAGNQIEKFQSVWLNYIWSPVQNVSYGVEIGQHSAKQLDGNDEDAVRLQGMLKYSF